MTSTLSSLVSEKKRQTGSSSNNNSSEKADASQFPVEPINSSQFLPQIQSFALAMSKDPSDKKRIARARRALQNEAREAFEPTLFDVSCTIAFFQVVTRVVDSGGLEPEAEGKRQSSGLCVRSCVLLGQCLALVLLLVVLGVCAAVASEGIIVQKFLFVF